MNKPTRQASLLAIAFIVSIPLGLAAQDEGFYPYSYARLSYVNGSVHVQRTSDLGYEQGEVNLALVQGDRLGTERGQAEIHFGRRNYLRLGDDTKVEFAVLPAEGDERIKIHLTEGLAYFRVSHLAADKGIEVHTPDASFYVLEEGLYRFDVRLDRETRAQAREGSLEAATEDGSVLVRSQEAVTAADGRLLGDPEYARDRGDGFDDWNGSRDAQFAQRSERQYLPSEISEYEEELDRNGHWVYERPYGNVWVPNVTYSDWRPYLYGRWVWYPVIGWTWVPYESWGWSVYHYGRWHWRFGLGWYWIPRHHWRPAWVHWWWDGDYIGWAPLSWYNRPVLVVNNVFYDRYDDRFFSAHNRAMTIVRRDHLQAREIVRRQIGDRDRDRIEKVSLRAEQPSIRPVVDNARPQAVAARRALAVRPGSRSEVKALAPSRTLASSRLRQSQAGSTVRARERSVAPADAGRSAAARPAVRNAQAESRAVRSYPSRGDSGNRDAAAVSSRRTSVASPARGNGAVAGDNAARVSERSAGASKKGETVKSYPSNRAARPTAAKERSSTVAASRSDNSGPASRSSYAAPSRSTGTSSNRTYSAPKPSRTSSNRSYSSPKSSSPSSNRTYSAPKSSGSSSNRSYSAPKSSGSSSRGSVGSARSGGSSGSARSSSSGKSGSSSKSSGSSSKSKSGGAKKKS